jgi:hypothetical protein
MEHLYSSEKAAEIKEQSQQNCFLPNLFIWVVSNDVPEVECIT